MAIAVLDQETVVSARDTWPGSWTWDDPDEYLLHMEELASQFAKQGAKPRYVFIDPEEYVDWCSETGQPVDSSQSRALFAAAFIDDGIPFDPKHSLWPMGITTMILWSELGDDVDLEGHSEQVDELIDKLTDWLASTEGRWVMMATAARSADHDLDDLWSHFRHNVLSQTMLTHCAEFLSVREIVEHSDKRVLVPNYGNHDPIEGVLALAEAGHGLFGVEYRDADDAMTFRAWSISAAHGVEPVGAEELGRRLGTPGAPSLACGWPALPALPA